MNNDETQTNGNPILQTIAATCKSFQEFDLGYFFSIDAETIQQFFHPKACPALHRISLYSVMIFCMLCVEATIPLMNLRLLIVLCFKSHRCGKYWTPSSWKYSSYLFWMAICLLMKIITLHPANLFWCNSCNIYWRCTQSSSIDHTFVPSSSSNRHNSRPLCRWRWPSRSSMISRSSAAVLDNVCNV